jgi:hypothetical protein
MPPFPILEHFYGKRYNGKTTTLSMQAREAVMGALNGMQLYGIRKWLATLKK